MTYEELATALDLTPDEVEILEDACDDAYGLYEAVWHMNMNGKHPELSQSARKDIAKQAIQKLLDRGWIRIYLGVLYTEVADEPLPPEQAQAAIDDPRQWESPQDIDGPWRCSFSATGEHRRLLSHI